MTGPRPSGDDAARLFILTARDRRRLHELHREVLEPSFASDELDSLGTLERSLEHDADPSSTVLVAVDRADEVVGGAVTMRQRGSPVALLAYLAVRPGRRGEGIGSRLLANLSGQYQQEGLALVLGEVEDPRRPALVTGQDPVGRLRLYERVGARLLPVRFVQPALAPGRSRIAHLLLLVLYADPSVVAGGPGGETIPATLVGGFVRRYFAGAEGAAPPFDPELAALLADLESDDRLALLDIAELDRIAERGSSSHAPTGPPA